MSNADAIADLMSQAAAHADDPPLNSGLTLTAGGKRWWFPCTANEIPMQLSGVLTHFLGKASSPPGPNQVGLLRHPDFVLRFVADADAEFAHERAAKAEGRP